MDGWIYYYHRHKFVTKYQSREKVPIFILNPELFPNLVYWLWTLDSDHGTHHARLGLEPGYVETF